MFRWASRLVDATAALFDAAESRWEGPRGQRALGTVLVVAFLAALGAIELRRRGVLPGALAELVPTSHFGAVGFVFTLLLVAEVIGLVFALARSVSESLGKQFEVFALILLRKAFLEFSHLDEPLEWHEVARLLPHVLTDMVGALAVFVLLGVYYRVQRHRAITAHAPDQASFVRAKKVLAMLLLVVFAFMVAVAAKGALAGDEVSHIFGEFYTVLVFSDILVVLISLRYSSKFRVVFRNSGYAAATTIIRLALSAPAYVNAALAVGAIAFAVAVSLAYNAFERMEAVPGAERPA